MDNKKTEELEKNKEANESEGELPFCTTAASAEHSRAANENEPCDDGRAGKVGAESQDKE